MARAGKAIWGEESSTFKHWFDNVCHRFKHHPPREAIGDLRLLQPKATTAEQMAEIDGALFYLHTRLKMVDYAHFRRHGYPIGSGMIESGQKVVVQRRLKGAGMRWAERHLDPMLSLRTLICNNLWETGWQQMVLFQQEQQTA